MTLYNEDKRSTNSYQPFLQATDFACDISREYFGMRLDFGKFYVTCENDAYVVWNADTDAVEDRLPINQFGGIDTENRIEKFKAWAELKNFR